MLPKTERLDRKTFLTVLETGKTVHSPFFSIKYKDFKGKSGFSAVVPKTVFKKAADRNTFRRRTYALVSRHGLISGQQSILFMKKEAKRLVLVDFYAELALFLKKNRIIS